jgi:DNA topoisomerase-2
MATKRMAPNQPKRIQANRQIRVRTLFAGPVRDYSIYACDRAIPNAIDGFKPSQRKVIFGTMKKGGIDPDNGIKVAQLANYIAEVSQYHHGEGSLSGTIVGLAQDYTGSNNINYLKPIGQFGSRLSKSAGADRYIYTALHPIFRKIFPKEDDLILKHLVDDGDEIEPEFYLPILPNVLINGANGMGTGFATNILCYNPDELKTYILNRLQGKKNNIKLVPWYKGFTGSVTRAETGQVTFKGIFERISSTKIRITELPIGIYQDDYKEFLNDLSEKDEKNPKYVPIVTDFDNNSSDKNWDWTISIPREIGHLEDHELMKKFKLIARETENFTMWKANGKIEKFLTAEAVCDYFTDFRLTKYEERRLAMLVMLKDSFTTLNEKIRFIRYYIENSQKVAKKTKAELEDIMRAEKFTRIDELLSIRIYNLTKDQIEKLEGQIEETNKLIKYYEETTDKELFVKDLKELKF